METMNNHDSTEVSLVLQLQDNNDNNHSSSMMKEVPVPPVLSLPPTDIIYMTYEGNFQTECISTILQIIPSCEEGNCGGDDDNSGNNVPITTNNDTKSENEISKQQQQQQQPQELSIILDRTVLHAQGGGQPTDIGQMVVIRSDSNEPSDVDTTYKQPSSLATTATKINIHKVLLDRSTGLIKHYGTIVSDPSNNIDDDTNNDGDDYNNKYNNIIHIGTMVHVQIDIQQRQILSECHTAGHVVDAAMVKCGYQFRPSKGYHFLDSPYVEYIGSFIDSTNTNNNKTKNKNQQQQQDEIVHQLQVAFQQLIHDNIDTQIELLSIEDAELRCNTTKTTTNGDKLFDLDAYCTNINDNKIVRIVTVAGYSCPCGGTHVHNTGILQNNLWNITGMKSKKGLIRIKYGRNVIL